jgi:rubrerythrin
MPLLDANASIMAVFHIIRTVLYYVVITFFKLKGGNNMLSTAPIDLNKVRIEDIDKEITRLGMIAELDAVNLYEQLAAMAKNELIKKALLDIAKEEKTHMGEFQTLLLMLDKQQEKELINGKNEIEELSEK